MINNTIIFGSVTLFSTIISFILDKKKTIQGIKKGLKMLLNILNPFLNILIIVAIVLYLIPENIILNYLGPTSGISGYIIASIIGSITLIPGFISYPIASSLISKGASYGIVAVFMTTLMMVGIITLPLEIKYFGKKAALIRNILNFVIAIIIGILIGVLMK